MRPTPVDSDGADGLQREGGEEPPPFLKVASARARSSGVSTPKLLCSVRTQRMKRP